MDFWSRFNLLDEAQFCFGKNMVLDTTKTRKGKYFGSTSIATGINKLAQNSVVLGH